MEDFRKNIDVAVSWLCEEWYNDKLLKKLGGDHPLHYEKCTLRLIDGFLPYLHPQDKVLTRFLSEIPELNRTILSRVKAMCRDPSVVQLALTSLLYLVMMKPPVKEVALDTVQDIWTDCEYRLQRLNVDDDMLTVYGRRGCEGDGGKVPKQISAIIHRESDKGSGDGVNGTSHNSGCNMTSSDCLLLDASLQGFGAICVLDHVL
jgi:hypothetical protein